MLGKISSSLRRSRSKRSTVAPKPRRNTGTTNSHEDTSHGLLSPPVTNSGRRTRSHEADRRRAYASTSRDEDDDYYYRQTPPLRRTNTHRRSPSPPPQRRRPTERRLRRRSTRDGSISADEDSRPLSPGSPPYPADRVSRRNWDRPTQPEPPAARPVIKQYPPETQPRRPVDRRRMSYDASYAMRPAAGVGAGAYKSSSPAGHVHPQQDSRPSSHRSRSREDARRSRRPDPNKLATEKPGRNPKAPSKSPPKSQSQASSESSPKPSGDFWDKFPQALATFAGFKALADHADTAKEWTDWLNNLQGAPEEIQALSAKATTAKDTITQIQHSIEARPDLVEGESGQLLKQQIDAAIKSTDASLEEMTKMLQELSNDGTEGTVWKGLQDFYSSYKYKDEWEGKIKEAEADLQRELGTLTTLMVNIYSRALTKPALVGSITIQPPSPAKSSEKSPTPSPPTKDNTTTSSRSPPSTAEVKDTPGTTSTTAPPSTEKIDTEKDAVSDKKDPPPVPVSKKSSRPPSPSKLAQEEANVGTGTGETRPDQNSPPTNQQKTTMNATQTCPPNNAPGNDTLLETGVHDSHEVALLDAAWNGDLDGAARELTHVSPMTRDLQGLTPLHLAVERDHLATAMLLRDHHIDCNARDNCGRTPLHLAARFASAATVEFLLEKCRAEPNSRTMDGRTPFHYGATVAVDGDEERRDVLRVLRDWGADPFLVDHKGRTPRDLAQYRDCWDAAATLRRAENAWEKKNRSGRTQRHGYKK